MNRATPKINFREFALILTLCTSTCLGNIRVGIYRIIPNYLFDNQFLEIREDSSFTWNFYQCASMFYFHQERKGTWSASVNSLQLYLVSDTVEHNLCLSHPSKDTTYIEIREADTVSFKIQNQMLMEDRIKWNCCPKRKKLNYWFVQSHGNAGSNLRCTYFGKKRIDTYFYSNGQVKRVLYFKNNLPHGSDIEYYPTGIIKNITRWKNGKRKGRCYDFNEKGNIEKIEKNGRITKFKFGAFQ